MKSANRARLALLALAVAGLAALATGSAAEHDVSSLTAQDHLDLTPQAPVAVRHLTVRVTPLYDASTGEPAAVTHVAADIQVFTATANGEEPVDVSLVRSSDGVSVPLTVSATDAQNNRFGHLFVPFESCGATATCEEHYTITFHLRGTEPEAVDWAFGAIATYASPVFTDLSHPGIETTIQP